MTSVKHSMRPEVMKKNYNIQLRELQRTQGAEFKRSDMPRLELTPRRYRKSCDTAGRNPARRHGNQWRGHFICGNDIDDRSVLDDVDVDADSFSGWVAEESVSRQMVVSILDIARPAKAKGVAKEFEVVDSVRRVIALEENDSGSDLDYDFWDDDEWEKVGVEQEKTYSAALRSNKR